MERKLLKDLGLSDDQINKIMDENGKDIEREKRGVETLKQQVTDLETQKTETDKTLADLQKKAKGNEEIEKTLAAEVEKREAAQKLADEVKAQHEAEIAERDRSDAISKIIQEYKPKNERAVLSYLDQSKIAYDPATKSVSGVKEQMDALKESDGYLLNSTDVKFSGMKPGEAGDGIEGTPSAPSSLGDAVRQHYEKGASK